MEQVLDPELSLVRHQLARLSGEHLSARDMGRRFNAVVEHHGIGPPVGRQSKNYLGWAKM
jgi:hypothetical protein